MYNDLEGSGRDLMRVLSLQFPRGTEENHGKFVRIVNVPAETRSEHLPNTSQERYPCANPLGWSLSSVASVHPKLS
jgi:hypothetical protein